MKPTRSIRNLFRIAVCSAALALGVQAQAQGTSSSTFGLSSGLVRISKSAPDLVSLGQNYKSTIQITANESVSEVVVNDVVPSGAEYVSSSPAAKVADSKLSWSFDSLAKGASQTITIEFKAVKQGSFASCATVAALPFGCVTTKVGKAELAISKNGPAQAIINDLVTYKVVVKNVGNMTAKNVVVTDTLPPGLVDLQGRTTISWPIGDLIAGQSHPIDVTAKAAKPGKHTNKVMAKADNTESVNAEASTVVLVPGLDITKSGPKMEFLGKNATYDIKVTNSGETPLTGVVVTDTAPAATTIVSASGANVIGNTASWNIAKLGPKESKSYKVVLTTMIPGTHANGVAVTSAEGLSDKASAATLWQGVSALLISMVDDPDPIRVNDSTTYTISVKNQGTLDDADIKLVATFGDELNPVSASNGATINGKTVTFPAWPKLGAKESFTYTIKAKGVKTGDHRLTVSRTSRDIPKPTTVEESTRVY